MKNLALYQLTVCFVAPVCMIHCSKGHIFFKQGLCIQNIITYFALPFREDYY